MWRWWANRRTTARTHAADMADMFDAGFQEGVRQGMRHGLTYLEEVQHANLVREENDRMIRDRLDTIDGRIAAILRRLD